MKYPDVPKYRQLKIKDGRFVIDVKNKGLWHPDTRAVWKSIGWVVGKHRGGQEGETMEQVVERGGVVMDPEPPIPLIDLNEGWIVFPALVPL